jgi:CubicO group peptidase (beta-lactamase class C family)
MDTTGYRFDPRLPHSVGHVRGPAPLVSVLRRALPAGIADARVDGYVSLRPFLVEGAGYGGLVGTVRDAARLAAMHAAGEGDDHPLLVQHDVEEMRTIRVAGKRFDHGIGWFRRPRDATRAPGFVEHYGTGGGFHNAMRIYPGSGLAMVAMANTTSGWDVDALFTRIEELAWR